MDMAANPEVTTTPAPSIGRSLVALLIISLAVAIGFTAMQSFGIMAESAKAELHLSDTALAVVQGVSAAIPLVILSIPIGIWIDRWNRVKAGIVRNAYLGHREKVACLAVDVHRADADVPGRFELHTRRDLVGMRLFQVGIDVGDRAAEAGQLCPLLAPLEHTISVTVQPRKRGAAEIVLVGR